MNPTMNHSINRTINQSKGSRSPCVMIEIGRSLTKVGFSSDPLPMRVVHTRPFINQSNKQSNKQSNNQLNKSSIDQSINNQRWPVWSVEQWVEWLNPYMRHLMLDLLGIQNQTINQTINTSANQSINQTINQTINHHARRICFIESLSQPIAMKQALMLVAYHYAPSIIFTQSTACASLAIKQSNNQTINQTINQTMNEGSLVIDIGMFDTTIIAQSNNQTISQSIKFCPVGVAHIIERFVELAEQSNSQSNNQTNNQTIAKLPWRVVEDFALPVIQAIKQSISQSVNPSNDQSSNQTLDIIITSDRPSFVATLDSFNQSIFCKPSEQSINHAISQPINLSINQSARMDCINVLFGDNEESDNLIDCLIDCLINQSINDRRTVLSSIIVTGGGSEIAGIKERIYNELMNRLSADQSINQSNNQSIKQSIDQSLKQSVKMCPKEPVTPSMLSWFGAAIYSSVILDEDEYWLSRDEIKYAINQSINQSNNHSEDDQSIKQSIKQSNNQSNNQMIRDLNEFWTFLPSQFRDWSYHLPVFDSESDDLIEESY